MEAAASSPYALAIASVAGAGLIALLLAPFAGATKSKAGLQPGQEPRAEYADRVWRIHRAHLNATEFLAAFAAVAFAAILAGADPFWTNLLAGLALLFRALHAAIYLGGVGSPNFGPRSIVFIGGWACAMALGLMSLLAMATG